MHLSPFDDSSRTLQHIANECITTILFVSQCLLAVLEGKENDPPLREIHENEGYDDDEGIAESGM